MVSFTERTRIDRGSLDGGRKLFPTDRFEDQIRTLRGNGRISTGAIRAAVDSAISAVTDGGGFQMPYKPALVIEHEGHTSSTGQLLKFRKIACQKRTQR